MPIAHRNDAAGEGLEGRVNGLRARHRLAFLAASAGLVIGSAVAVVGPTSAAAKTTVHSTAFAGSSASHVKTGDLTLAGQTPSPFSAAAANIARSARSDAALPAIGRERAGLKGCRQRGNRPSPPRCQLQARRTGLQTRSAAAEARPRIRSAWPPLITAGSSTRTSSRRTRVCAQVTGTSWNPSISGKSRSSTEAGWLRSRRPRLSTP